MHEAEFDRRTFDAGEDLAKQIIPVEKSGGNDEAAISHGDGSHTVVLGLVAWWN